MLRDHDGATGIGPAGAGRPRTAQEGHRGAMRVRVRRGVRSHRGLPPLTNAGQTSS